MAQETTHKHNVRFYGFMPVPRDPEVLFKDHPTASGPNPKQIPFSVESLPLPDSPVVQAVKEFVKKELDEQTYNHSHRVYFYGTAITKTHFPEWQYDQETYYLACLLHDIGTADKFLTTTKMSFEFKGAIVARDLILSQGGVEDQADSVCDAIIRHQDIFVKGGNITVIGQVLQLATILDNVGLRANLIHPTLIESATTAYPRKGWSEHFAKVIEKELETKPWCHTSTFEVPNWKEGIPSNFATDVRGNEVMRKYD
ncbi:cyanamide hydratase [Panus rudis PR-1116 ss-1]|nr:cyanamide hydratase [Panus rudis PR-1116 ss-1]